MNYDRVKKITAFVICGSFLLGAVAGVIFAGMTGEDMRSALGAELISRVAENGISVLRAFSGCMLPVAAATAAGLTVYCRGVYPVIFFFRGMNAAYAVSAVYGAFPGRAGIVAVLGMFGLKNALLLAGLLILCMDAYAKTLGGKRRPEGEQCYVPDRAFVVRSVVCAVFAAAAALSTVYISPGAASGALGGAV